MELLLAPGPDLPLPGGAGAARRPSGGGHHIPLGLVQGVRVKLRPCQAGKVKPTFYSHVRFQFRIKKKWIMRRKGLALRGVVTKKFLEVYALK